MSVPTELAAPATLRQMTAELRSTGIFHCDTRLADGEALDLPELPGTVMFHLVLNGECTVQAGSHRELIGPGAVAVLPHGRGHRIATGQAGVTSLEDAERHSLGGIVEQMWVGHGPTTAHVICGALTVEHPAAPALPATLDPLLVTHPADAIDGGQTRVLAELILAEARTGGPGWVEITSRLVDVVAMRAIRQVVHDSAETPGWWSALRDPRLVETMRAVMDSPATGWTLPVLAHQAAMSRSAYAQLFHERVGESPMSWVTRYRMRIARGFLQDGQSVARVARTVGYDSEVGFRRAFARVTGTTPGAVRKGGSESAPDQRHDTVAGGIPTFPVRPPGLEPGTQ